MQFLHVNILAVLLAGLSTMVVGFLWYLPVLFAESQMLEMGYDCAEEPLQS